MRVCTRVRVCGGRAFMTGTQGLKASWVMAAKTKIQKGVSRPGLMLEGRVSEDTRDIRRAARKD